MRLVLTLGLLKTDEIALYVRGTFYLMMTLKLILMLLTLKLVLVLLVLVGIYPARSVKANLTGLVRIVEDLETEAEILQAGHQGTEAETPCSDEETGKGRSR